MIAAGMIHPAIIFAAAMFAAALSGADGFQRLGVLKE